MLEILAMWMRDFPASRTPYPRLHARVLTYPTQISTSFFQRKPLYHFITTVLAIIGGTFTVAGMIDSMVSGDKQYKIFIVNVMNVEGYNDS